MPKSPDLGWAAREPAVAHVFADGDELADALTITGPDGHHLARVRRLRVGESVTVADGSGTWRRYLVERVAEGSVTLVADAEVRTEPRLEPPLSVAFALTKGQKPEIVVARLTELGVDRVIPVAAARSVVRWDPARAATALERLQLVAREAAMQCRRSWHTTVDPVRPIAMLAGEPGLVVADLHGGPVAELPVPGPEGWLVVVGPEGGLDPDEVEALGAAPTLGVGPYVLRAETAAVAAAAALTTRRRTAGGHGG